MVRDVVAEYIPFSKVRGWWGLTVLLVTDFESFVERKINRPGIRYEVIMMLVIGGLGGLGMYYVSQNVLEASSLDEMAFVAIGRTARPIAIPMIFWAIYTILFYFVSGFIGGYGHARRLVKGIAWAFLPFALSNAVRSVALWWVYRDFPYQDTFEGFGPADHYESVLREGIQEPAMLFATGILVVCIIWSAYLMVPALQHARSLSRSSAIRIVGVVYAIHVLLVIYFTYQSELSGALMF